jgi:hypothetical protein
MTLTTRQKLIVYLADAGEDEVDALYEVVKEGIIEKSPLILTDEQLHLLNTERELHLSGKTKSYSRKETIEIIKR